MSGDDGPPNGPQDDHGEPGAGERDQLADDPAAEPGRADTEAPGGAPGRESDPAPGDARTPNPDEVFCYSCGEVIKGEAEICPACGVRQRVPPGGDPTGPRGQSTTRPADLGLTAARQRKLERKANNDRLSTFVLSLFVPPLAYVEVGKPGYAIVNFLTANFLLLGLVVVPFHTHATVSEAREQLRDEGVWGY
jgi:hypothetical protein